MNFKKKPVRRLPNVMGPQALGSLIILHYVIYVLNKYHIISYHNWLSILKPLIDRYLGQDLTLMQSRTPYQATISDFLPTCSVKIPDIQQYQYNLSSYGGPRGISKVSR